jgi:hypothetical protein
MNAEPVKNAPVIVPTMYAYRPASGLIPASRPRGEAVGDALHAQHQARHGILTQRGSPEREAELHLEARMSWPSRPGSSARTAPTTVATTMMNAHADSQLYSVNATPRSPYCCWLLATRSGR